MDKLERMATRTKDLHKIPIRQTSEKGKQRKQSRKQSSNTVTKQFHITKVATKQRSTVASIKQAKHQKHQSTKAPSNPTNTTRRQFRSRREIQRTSKLPMSCLKQRGDEETKNSGQKNRSDLVGDAPPSEQTRPDRTRPDQNQTRFKLEIPS